MTGSGEIWEVLGISPTADLAAIRRAYAHKLRATRPEDDPEGFMRLHAAYESAKRAADPASHAEQPPMHIAWHAGSVTRVSLATGPAIPIPTWPKPGARSTSHTADDPQPAEALRARMRALQSALRPEAQEPEAELLELQREVLALAKSGTVMSQSDAERDLAEILLRNTPRSDPLFADYVHWLHWRSRERELAADPLLFAVLERYEDAQLLVPLRSGQHPLAAAFKRLSQPANPLQRMWRAHVSQQTRWPELQVLSLLDEAGRPHLVRELNEAEVAWWRSFATSPRLSHPLLLLGYMFVFPVTALGFLGAVTEGAPWPVLLLGVLVPVAYLGLLLVKLYLIDWPPHWVARRVPSLPLAIQAGWLPLMTAICVAAPLPGVPRVPGWGTAMAGAAGCLWALYVSAPAPVFTSSRAGQAMVVNAALALWGVKAVTELAAPPWSVPHAAFAGAAWLVCASGLGLQALRAAWSRVAGGRRGTCRAVLAACGVAVAGVLVTASTPAWQPTNVGLVVSFVAVHRAALDFRWQDIKARMIVLALCACLAPVGLLVTLLVTQMDMSAPITRAGGLVLVTAALFDLALAPGESAVRAS